MRTTQARFWIIGVLSLFGLLLGGSSVFASSDNISGYIWGGDNATLSYQNLGNFVPTSGWTWSNNTNNTGGIGFTSLGDGATYGLNADDAGLVTGYAWSSNYGWINFNAGCLGRVGVGGMDDVCSAQFLNVVTPTDANFQNKTDLVGWARACSVFDESSANGHIPSQCGTVNTDLKPDIQRGGWDGWISLSSLYNGVIPGGMGIPTYRVTWNPTTTHMSGYAWGGDVVGWINFAGATMEAPNQPLVATLTSPNSCSTAGGNVSLTWGVTGTGASTYTCTGSRLSDGKKWLSAPAVSSATVTATVGAVPETFILSCTSSNQALPPLSATYKMSSNVCSGPVLKIEQNPTWAKTLPTGEQCVDPGDIYSPQVTVDLSSLPPVNAALASTRCDVNWGKDIGIGVNSMCLNRNAAGNAYVVFANNIAHPSLWLNDHNRTWHRCANQGGTCNTTNTPGPGLRKYIYGISGTNNYVMQTLDQPTCDGVTFGTADIPGAQCFFDPSNSPTPEVNIIVLNGTDRTPGPNFGTPFSEMYPPTDITVPSIMDILTYSNNQAFGDGAVNGANGQGWNTVDYLYPKEAYFDVGRCTTYLTGYANEMWVINHPSDPISNTVPFKEGNNFVFKLNDNLPSFYGTTAHNDPTIGPHQQCIVFPQNKNSYSCHYAGTATCAAPVLDPIYAKPQPPYDKVTLSYCEMSTSLSAKPASCQVYGTPINVTWSVPSANAITCTASMSCMNASGQSVACAGWSGSKLATAGSHTQAVTITATGGAQQLTANLSLTCDNPTSGKTSTSATAPILIQPNVAACTTAGVCGNAVVESPEQCDFGASNGIKCDAYGANCKYCGSAAADGAVNACKIIQLTATSCGDGIINGQEECDAGVGPKGNGFIPSVLYGETKQYCGGAGVINDVSIGACKIMTISGGSCGDENIDPSETCDDGADNTDTCTPDGAPCSYCPNASQPNACITNTIAPPVVSISNFTIPSCVVSGDDSKPVASWISDAATCKLTGTDTIGGIGIDTVPLFSSPNTSIDPILPLGNYNVVLTCDAPGAISASKDASFKVQTSCPTGGGGGTMNAPIQPVYIDS